MSSFQDFLEARRQYSRDGGASTRWTAAIQAYPRVDGDAGARPRYPCVAMLTPYDAIDAFLQEHRRCGAMDGGVEDGRVLDDVRVRGRTIPLMRTRGEGSRGSSICPSYARGGYSRRFSRRRRNG